MWHEFGVQKKLGAGGGETAQSSLTFLVWHWVKPINLKYMFLISTFMKNPKCWFDLKFPFSDKCFPCGLHKEEVNQETRSHNLKVWKHVSCFKYAKRYA